MYVHGPCRCDECAEANTVYHRKLVKRLRERTPPQHGANGYTNYGCRCPVCTTANTTRCRDYRQAKALQVSEALDA